MKIRTGFVSNSSSSSFICNVCGNYQEGYDLSAEDVEMVECNKGHTFCECHFDTDGKTFKEFEDDTHIKNDRGWDIDLRYELPEEFCPVCKGTAVDPREAYEAIMAVAKLNKDEIIDIIRQYREMKGKKK